MTSEKPPRLELPAWPPFIFGIPFAIGIALHFVFGSIRLGLPVAATTTLGAILLVASIALAVWASLVMLRAGESPEPYRPTEKIIDYGPFGLSRHPIYLAYVIGGFGVALALNSVFILASVPVGVVAIDRIVIEREEDYLFRLFGDAYRQYASRVRRWL